MLAMIAGTAGAGIETNAGEPSGRRHDGMGTIDTICQAFNESPTQDTRMTMSSPPAAALE